MMTYLNTYYLTLEQLVDKTHIAVKNIEDLIKHHCIPKHSHRVICQTVFETAVFSNTTIVENEKLFYHPSLIDWIIAAENYRKNMDFSEIKKKIKSDFMLELRSALIEADIKKYMPDIEIEEYIEKKWKFVMDGTYGVCLKEISAKNIVIKAIAVAVLEKWIAAGKPKLSEKQHREILDMAKLYDQVAAHFGPHEISKSTRGRLYDVFMNTSLLQYLSSG